MKESSFVRIFEIAAKEILGKNMVVKKGSSLLYELFLNEKLELAVKNLKAPKRGYSAFQTDICIYEVINKLDYPRVVIEFKTKITTHDIITYSAKAGKHKLIYPGLRYGLLASDLTTIPDRFFIHNENIDFFLAAKDYRDNEGLSKMIKELIETEVKTSKILETTNLGNQQFNYYRTDIVFKNFQKK